MLGDVGHWMTNFMTNSFGTDAETVRAKTSEIVRSLARMGISAGMNYVLPGSGSFMSGLMAQNPLEISAPEYDPASDLYYLKEISRFIVCLQSIDSDF